MITSALISPVLFVRWQQACEVSDVDRITRAIEMASRDVGPDLVYIASIPEKVPPPDTDTRAALRAGTEHANAHCASIHLVIEGHGLRRAIIRSVSAGLLLATRASFSIHTEVLDALEAASQRVPMNVARVRAAARSAGMVAA
ncbi:MAG: hypothetical protein AAGA54_03830 [Myxococcota bacterium]